MQEEFDKKTKGIETEKKIAKSGAVGKARVEIMVKRDDMLEKCVLDARVSLRLDLEPIRKDWATKMSIFVSFIFSVFHLICVWRKTRSWNGDGTQVCIGCILVPGS